MFTISDYNNFMNKILDAKITAKYLVNKPGLNEMLRAKRKHQSKRQSD